MHLSKQLQGHLDKLNSNVKLGLTIDGTSPDKYSFIYSEGKSFRTEFALTEKEFSIVLFENSDYQNYENCFARGQFKDLERLATVIDLWVDKQKDILEIQKHFGELELFSDFEPVNSNVEIEKAWTKVKNMFFNDNEFWKNIEWKNRYIEMLKVAKQHESFKNYYPFTSHYWLRFSADKDLKDTWVLDIYMIPTVYSQEIPTTFGKFYISYNDQQMGGQYFETVEDGLDFYAKKLKEIKPIKWNIH